MLKMIFGVLVVITVFLAGSGGMSILKTGGWNKYKYDKNPVTPDNHTWGCVIKEGNNWAMYYSVAGNLTYIGRKISMDGKNWTDQGAVLERTPGAWDNEIWCPSVIKIGNEYKMLYTGRNNGVTQVGLATSADGVNWTKYEGNPVFNCPDEWAHNDTEGFGIIYIKEEKKILLFYNTLSHSVREIGIAESEDFVNWTPHQSTPVFSTSIFSRLKKKLHNLLGIQYPLFLPTIDDYRYHQFCACQFRYGNKYYALVPSQSWVRDYAKIALYECDNPYFSEKDRIFRGFFVSGSEEDFDFHDIDTPCPVIFDNKMYLYYSGEHEGIWHMGLIEISNLSSALKESPVSITPARPAPAFEAVFAIIGLLAYIIRRNRQK